jgi:hypothetical protein
MEKEECHHLLVVIEIANVSMIHVFFPSSVTFVFYLSIVVHDIFHFDYMPFCYILNVVHVVAPILTRDYQLVNNENMSHGQSFAKVTPLEHVAPTTLGPKVTTKPKYSFMKCKTMAIGSDDLPAAKRGSTSSHYKMKVNF